MKIISWNVNGLRAVYKKGFLEWLKKSKADIVCLQEIKAQMDKVPVELQNPAGYFSFYNPAHKKGYSGTAVFVKQKPLKIINKMGFSRFDNEGRILRLDYPNFVLINLYLPHGGRDKGNLKYKLEVYKNFLKYLKNIKKPLVLMGDFNVAHQEIDLARPKQNKNNIMFTLEERAQIDKLVEIGLMDAFRKFHPNEKKYTWWPYFADARARNLGWRIDYSFVSKNLATKLKSAEILSDIMGSDHCPVALEIYRIL